MSSFDHAVLPPTPMTADGMDRRTEERPGDALLTQALERPDTLFAVFIGDSRLPSHVLVGEGRRRALLTRDDAQPHLDQARALVALGDLGQGGRPVVAVLARAGARPGASPAPSPGARPDAGAGGAGRVALEAATVRVEMSAASAGEDIPYLSALSQAQAVLAWHATHEFSPETGRPTRATTSGWVREDPADGTEFFPRTDPAVIVALVDEQDRIILGHNSAWPTTRYSTLAGFVEPSETPEAAVVRELREEAGVVVERVRYLGSQPWPFPRSLMLGYIATTSSVPEADGVEITHVKAFTRAELDRAVEAGELELPNALSISRALITAWKEAEAPAQ